MSFAEIRKLLVSHEDPEVAAEKRRVKGEAELLNAESAFGRKIFGAVPDGHTREFFHHKKNVWIWYEDGVTMRYEVRPHGVFKKVGDGKYQVISGKELENFRQATKVYLELVKKHLYV
ncbi:MAG: hypothetical protein LBT19_03485 [Candidatus Nomurabacteria bacterium]|jgi:hypothetical protein|nr:hypothetical protein [Candidatus Nomurabacteria bacterium]